MEEIKWGIIGCGKVTELKSGPAFNKIEHSRLVAVMRRNAVLAEDYARRHGVPEFYSDADKIIHHPEINAVYVATPPSTHAEYAIRAMKAGKAVYVEKPMALNPAECREMIRVSEETGQPLFVAYYRRSLPAFLRVKELIEAGAIGKPLTVSVRLHRAFRERDSDPAKQTWHVNPEVAGGGFFYDLGSHQFDYLDFLFGPVTEVHGIAANLAGFYKTEDTVSASFRFESGVVGDGSWCFVVDKASEIDRIEITGSEGYIRFSSFLHGDVELMSRGKQSILSFKNPENISFFLIQQVVNELRGKGKCNSTLSLIHI